MCQFHHHFSLFESWQKIDFASLETVRVCDSLGNHEYQIPLLCPSGRQTDYTSLDCAAAGVNAVSVNAPE